MRCDLLFSSVLRRVRVGGILEMTVEKRPNKDPILPLNRLLRHQTIIKHDSARRSLLFLFSRANLEDQKSQTSNDNDQQMTHAKNP